MIRDARTFEVPFDPDATSIYDLRVPPPPQYVGRSTAIRAARQDIAGLRAAIADGWDVGPELAHEERRLATLEAAARRRSAKGR